MRAIQVIVVAIVALLGARVGNAQLFQVPTPAPQVTAASADWQLGGEPIFYAGEVYVPSGPTVFFDGNVMVRTGDYEGVPLYANATLEQYSVVFVPVGRNEMRPYERRRGALTEAKSPVPPVIPETPRAVGTGGVFVTPPRAGAGTTVRRPSSRTPAVRTLPPARSNAGIWLDFNGTRWYSGGSAVTYSPEQFRAIGTYRGLPVYQKQGGSNAEIFIPSVANGPLAPFRRK